ncbi:MAG: alpha/beta hydrolase [Myxococcota bacterium]|nr:alpha/beta hydrolase [Myxococcota bacterium]
MPLARANGIDIEYETSGPTGKEPLLLIMGLGTQLIGWPDEFCQMLASLGHQVIRYDNRDVGLSTKFDDSDYDAVTEALAKAASGQPVKTAYLLSDMAADAAGLLDALGVERAHVVGASMGGMIAQALAIDFPERVATLTSVMSSTGEPGLTPPSPASMEVLLRPKAVDRETAIEQSVDTWRVIGSPGYPFDETGVRERAALAFDRCHHPAGSERQLVAIFASGSRREALGGVATPTLVIHGDDDPLVPVDNGHATQAAIPGAEGLFLPGMGHDLPDALFEPLSRAIHEHGTAHPTR